MGLGIAASPTRSKADERTQADKSSPLVQELLRRTEEKKEERYKERLQDYYRKNYKDYFEFESKKANYGRTEVERKIQDWLEQNKE